VAALRVLKKQNAHLTKKQLSKLIAHTREFMSKTPVSH
jgi:hypothetical protein